MCDEDKLQLIYQVMSNICYLEHFTDLFLHILEIDKSLKKQPCVNPNFILGLYKHCNFELIYANCAKTLAFYQRLLGQFEEPTGPKAKELLENGYPIVLGAKAENLYDLIIQSVLN